MIFLSLYIFFYFFLYLFFFFFFFNDTATTEIYTLSLHDALPISPLVGLRNPSSSAIRVLFPAPLGPASPNTSDRKSTRLNSSHANISYAVFCLKKKKNQKSTDILKKHIKTKTKT